MKDYIEQRNKETQRIALEIQTEWQMVGIAEGIYLDFARAVTKRYVIGLLEKMRERLEGMKKPNGHDPCRDYIDGCEECADGIYNQAISDTISYLNEQIKLLKDI